MKFTYIASVIHKYSINSEQMRSIVSISIVIITCVYGEFLAGLFSELLGVQACVTTLKVDPVVTENIALYDKVLQIGSNNGNQFAVTIKNNINIAPFSDSVAMSIAKEIILNEGRMGRHVWEFKLQSTSAELYIMNMIADCNNGNVHITGGIAKISQTFKPLNNYDKHCANTGPRRYGFCGPREEECHYTCDSRSPNQAEVNVLMKNIEGAIPIAIKLISP